TLVFLATTATPKIYTLSLHDALPIYRSERGGQVDAAVDDQPPDTHECRFGSGGWHGRYPYTGQCAGPALVDPAPGQSDQPAPERAGSGGFRSFSALGRPPHRRGPAPCG